MKDDTELELLEPIRRTERGILYRAHDVVRDRFLDVELLGPAGRVGRLYDQLLRAGQWSRSNAGLLALSAVAVVTVAGAVISASAPDRRGAPEATSVAAAPQATTQAPRPAQPEPFSNLDPEAKSKAEMARDHALAARFRSAKAEATSLVPDLHLAAQRKEIDADTAFNRRDFRTAIALYEIARDGYEIAASRAEMHAASREKAMIDAQILAEASARAGTAADRLYNSYQAATPQQAMAPTQPASPGQIRPIFLEPLTKTSQQDATVNYRTSTAPSAPKASPGVSGANAAEAPSDYRVSAEPPKEVKASAGGHSYAAVFAEPSDGHRSGGTWGACRRTDPQAAQACARASCEERSNSPHPCVQVAASGPGEHCVVARASGYDVSAGACRPDAREAAAAALAGCRQEVSWQYGDVGAACQIAWSSAG